MEEDNEVLYELKPKFDFFYELAMPTGRRMKSAFISMILAIIINIVLLVARGAVVSQNNATINLVYNVCSIAMLIVLLFTIILFVGRIIFQILEYKGITYTFYKDCLIFENNFLNQTKKTIEYSNIKEVEIRRTVLDRMLNYGVIIIYTNADKAHGSATVIYAIKNTQEHYDKIEKIIHNKNVKKDEIVNIDKVEEPNVVEKEETNTQDVESVENLDKDNNQ